MDISVIKKKVYRDPALYDPYARALILIRRKTAKWEPYFADLRVPNIQEVNDDVFGGGLISTAGLVPAPKTLIELSLLLIHHPHQTVKLYSPEYLDAVKSDYIRLLNNQRDQMLAWPLYYSALFQRGRYYVNVIWCWIDVSGADIGSESFTWCSLEVKDPDSPEHLEKLRGKLRTSHGGIRMYKLEECWDLSLANVLV